MSHQPMHTTLAKLSPTLSMVGLSLLGAFSDTIQGFVAEHPETTMTLATLITAVGNLMTPPKLTATIK